MTVHTWNTLYRLKDLQDDGSCVMEGNPRYFPRPLRCRLSEAPEIGKCMYITFLEGDHQHEPICTTPVMEIISE